MKLYFSKTYSDHDEALAEEAKLGMIYASKDELLEVCEFFEKVKNHITNNDICHMHFRDYYEDWDEDKYIDLEVNLK